MHGKQANILEALVTAAGQWRTTATTANVELTQINVVFPDGRPVVMLWDAESNDWEITI